MWRATASAPALPLCNTKWAQLLVTQDGTGDHAKLRELDAGGARAFRIYARLRNQLAQRALHEIAVTTGDTHPFAWEHVRSNDFAFEDCMRIVAEAVRLVRDVEKDSADEAGRARALANALGMFTFLLQSKFVKMLQRCAALPHWLKHEKLSALKTQAAVKYIRAFADGYYTQRFPLERDPLPNMPVRHWLAQNGTEFDKAMLDFVRGEILFQRAIDEDSEKHFRCAVCFVRKAARCKKIPRAAEREKYFMYFKKMHFSELDVDTPHECLTVVPENPLDISRLLNQSEKPFSWDVFAGDHIFTV